MLNAQARYHTYVRGQMAAVVSFGAALILCGMALFRVGTLMKFISPSVLTGFVTGSGVYIFLSQSKYIFGFKVRACVRRRVESSRVKSMALVEPTHVPMHASQPRPPTHPHPPLPNSPPPTAAARQGADPRVPVPLLAHRHRLGQVRHGDRDPLLLRALVLQLLPPRLPATVRQTPACQLKSNHHLQRVRLTDLTPPNTPRHDTTTASGPSARPGPGWRTCWRCCSRAPRSS